jgi:hypothetical protein
LKIWLTRQNPILQFVIKEIVDRAKSDAKKEAQKVIVQAIQRTAADILLKQQFLLYKFRMMK